MTLDFIYRLSKLTNSSPRFWVHLQVAWLYHQYIQKRKTKTKIPMLSPKIAAHTDNVSSPGKLIEKNLLLLGEYNIAEVSRKMKVSGKMIAEVISGSLGITPETAVKLGEFFETDAKYWLDVRSTYEFEKLFEQRRDYIDAYRIDIKKFRATIKPERSIYDKKIIHPLTVLFDKFIKPTKIPLSDWLKALGISPMHYDSIRTGNGMFTIFQILRMCCAFKTKPSFWIDLENRFLISKARNNLFNKERSSLNKQAKTKFEQPLHPGKMLINNYLKPMHVSVREFAKYIGVTESRMFGMTGGHINMDFELAIRVGEATGTDPKYWLSLQSEYDIQKYEDLKGNQRTI